jgi:catalase (peroxidase I)
LRCAALSGGRSDVEAASGRCQTLANQLEQAPRSGGVRALLGRTNKDWWPDMLATEILSPNGPSNPMGADFDYAEAFKALDYTALKADLTR